MVYEATVLNETDSEVRLMWDSLYIKEPIAIESGVSIAVPWYILCVTVESEKVLRHYQVPEFLPKNVQTSGRFSSFVTFPIVISDNRLNFKNKSGDLIPMQEVNECGGA